jgi:hypothetical protein
MDCTCRVILPERRVQPPDWVVTLRRVQPPERRVQPPERRVQPPERRVQPPDWVSQ